VDLTWRPLSRSELGIKRRDAAYGERPRPDIRAFGETGVWATLSQFSPDLVKKAVSERPKWKSKRVIVLDVRGNTGGSSILGYQLLTAFLGRPPPLARPRPYDEWRASKGNLEYLEMQLLPLVRQVYDKQPRILRELERTVAGIRTALASGQALYRQEDNVGNPDNAADDMAAMAGTLEPATAERVFVLTDGRCVSACLDFVDVALRYPQVVHVGRATDADTPYTEVRPDIPLPSSLATMSLAMIVCRNRPRNWKPFVPRHSYPGDIADTKKLEEWVNALVLSERPSAMK
jgi:hypothetical protein